MATKEKTPNYTPEQTTALVAAYVAVANKSEAERKAVVEQFAAQFGKNVRSIVAKLTRENVYVAKEYKTKTGEPSVKKDEHADAIGKILRLSEPEIESLTKANKGALAKIFKALAESKPIDGTDTHKEGSGE